MKQYIQPHTRYIGLLLMVLTLGCFWQPTNAAAEDVVLNPGYISGTVKIGELKILRVKVWAKSGNNSSTTTNNSDNYTISVNTPLTGSIDYTIGGEVLAQLDGKNLWMTLLSQTVSVSAGQTSVADFNITPGYITGTVYNTGTAGIKSATVYATSPHSNTRISTAGGIKFVLPVWPNQDFVLHITAYDNYNNTYHNYFNQSGIAENNTATKDCTFNINAPKYGNLTGEFYLNGIGNTPVQHYFGLSNYYLGGYNVTLAKNGTYQINNVKTGSYNWFSAKTTFYKLEYGYRTRLREIGRLTYPHSVTGRYNSETDKFNKLTITPGGTTTHNIIADAAYIKGHAKLTGSRSIQGMQISSGVGYNGSDYLSDTYGGSAGIYIDDTETGAFKLTVTPGVWYFNGVGYSVRNSDPNNYIAASTGYKDITQKAPITVTAGNTTIVDDITYEAGTVTVVNFLTLGGGGTTIKNQTLTGICDQYNTDKTQRISQTYFQAFGHPTEDKVTIVAIPGTYTVTASADVDGSHVTFDKIIIEVFPNTDTVIDLAGPTLNILNPTPEFYTTGEEITVSGLTSDDDGIDNVTVNGATVTLAPTGNEENLNEVSFGTSIALTPGPNTIETTSTDKNGNASSDTRTIYRDSGPPTLEWTPAGGSMTSEDSVTVKGTASDDNEITKVTVNGESVLFSSTNNPEDPNEVEFSSTVHLNDGPNQIVVATQDNCRRTTTQTHTVSKVFNSPPTANAGPDQTVSAGADCETMVTLNGAGSSDPDGDALSYLWTGSFGAVSGSQPELGLGKGTHVITLTVSDGSFSDSDTVTITVVDDTPPELAISLDQTSLWPANHKYVTTNISARATDNCDAEIGSMVQLVSVTSDESEDMQKSGNKKDGGDGNTNADIVIVDNNSVKIRAERSGGGDGRVYTFNCNVTDYSGNTTTASATAVVPHNPQQPVVDSGVKYTVRP